MPCEFQMDLCFIREHTPSPFQTVIAGQMNRLFTGRGTWYIDYRVEDGLDIAVAEVKGLAAWETEDEVLRYVEENASMDLEAEADCWNHLQGYQLKVSPKVDAGCCRLQTR